MLTLTRNKNVKSLFGFASLYIGYLPRSFFPIISYLILVLTAEICTRHFCPRRFPNISMDLALAMGLVVVNSWLFLISVTVFIPITFRKIVLWPVLNQPDWSKNVVPFLKILGTFNYR